MADSDWDQVGPTGFSEVTGSFLIENWSALKSFGSGSHGPSGCGARPPARGPAGARVSGRCGRQGAAAGTRCSPSGGVGREAASPVSAPLPSPSTSHAFPPLPTGKRVGERNLPPGRRGVCVPSAPLPPAGLSWLPEAGVSRKSLESVAPPSARRHQVVPQSALIREF